MEPASGQRLQDEALRKQVQANNRERRETLEAAARVAGVEMSKCMLSQYVFFSGGLLVGTALSVRQKSYWPMAGGAFAGALGDHAHGRYVACAPHRAEVERAAAALAAHRAEEVRQYRELGGLGNPRDFTAVSPRDWVKVHDASEDRKRLDPGSGERGK